MPSGRRVVREGAEGRQDSIIITFIIININIIIVFDLFAKCARETTTSQTRNAS